MKRYESPMILLNEELAEGVYAASGAGKIHVEIVDGNRPWQHYM